MVDIMSHINQYVPFKSVNTQVNVPSTGESVTLAKVYMEKLLFGGDQLTVARARGAKKTRMNSTSAEKRFDGIIPCVENWHTKPVLLEVNCASTCGLCIIFVKCFCNFLNACTKLLASIEMLIVLTVVFYHKSYGSTFIQKGLLLNMAQCIVIAWCCAHAYQRMNK